MVKSNHLFWGAVFFALAGVIRPSDAAIFISGAFLVMMLVVFATEVN